MNTEQCEAIIRYIDAAIEKALDDGNSADGGLISAMSKDDALEKLRALVSKPTPQ